MKIKTFRNKIRNLIEPDKDYDFVTYTNKDDYFKHLRDNEIVVCGEYPNTFLLTITKIL